MSLARLAWLVLSLSVVVACPRQINQPTDAGPDASDFIPCSSVEDCPDPDPTRTRCDGVCLTICNGVDEACPQLNQFCNQNGTCAIGCRDSTTCGEGEVCVNGNCQVAASECATKCDCDPGEVCIDGACQSPPSTCSNAGECPRGPRTPEDRCEAFQCNGFTDQCFDPDPQPCTSAADCVGRPGCTGGALCACTAAGACVPDVACTVQDEATSCGAGNFCDGNGDCQALPACADADDCTPFGLTCNAGSGRCERPQACTGTAACTVPPNTFCDIGTGFCTVPNCINGGVTCQNGLECSQTSGRCVQPGTGTACTSDVACPASQYCDIADQECRVGCRDNASCPADQTCDGSHQCTGGGAGGQFGDACASDADCSSPMICGVFTGTCAEPCSDASDCVACNARNGSCRCNGFGFCAFP